MAIALIVVGVVEIFAQVGIGPSVVQFAKLRPQAHFIRLVVQRMLGRAFFRGHVHCSP